MGPRRSGRAPGHPAIAGPPPNGDNRGMPESASAPIPLPPATLLGMALDFEIGIAAAYLKADPLHREALEMLGHALTRRGRHAEALEVDRRLVAMEPENAYVRYNYACSLSNLGAGPGV
jgi:hypothetical protein